MSRDILSPPITVVGNRRYRVNVVRDDYGGTGSNLFKKGYQEDDLFGDDDEESYEVEELPNNIFKSSFQVPRAFYGGLIGQKGLTKKRIESESKTEITIPGIRATGDSLVSIKGKSRKDVCAGRRRLELVIKSLRTKSPATHFACVPVCSDEISKSFNHFKQSVLSEGHHGIDEALFVLTEKLHITFTVCTLLDDEERVHAAQIFQECKYLVANNEPIDVVVHGLEIMNDDPSSVRILYAGIESPDLQELANKVSQKFKATHLCTEDRSDNVKLHMTLLNGGYRLKSDPSSSNSFDARSILKKYANYKFGTFRVTEIHLSQMHTTAENGFYAATGIISV